MFGSEKWFFGACLGVLLCSIKDMKENGERVREGFSERKREIIYVKSKMKVLVKLVASQINQKKTKGKRFQRKQDRTIYNK